MVFFLRGQISLMGFFWRAEKAKPNGLVVDFDAGRPAAVFFPNASVPACVAFAFASVVRVLNIRCFSQVAEAIVGTITICVVDLLRRPLPRHVQPSQPVRIMQVVVQPDSTVSSTHKATRHVAGPALTAFRDPREHAGFGVVCDKLAKAISRKFVLHTTVNISYWRECQQ